LQFEIEEGSSNSNKRQVQYFQLGWSMEHTDVEQEEEEENENG